jgi:hypothetical protein
LVRFRVRCSYISICLFCLANLSLWFLVAFLQE